MGASSSVTVHEFQNCLLFDTKKPTMFGDVVFSGDDIAINISYIASGWSNVSYKEMASLMCFLIGKQMAIARRSGREIQRIGFRTRKGVTSYVLDYIREFLSKSMGFKKVSEDTMIVTLNSNNRDQIAKSCWNAVNFSEPKLMRILKEDKKNADKDITDEQLSTYHNEIRTTTDYPNANAIFEDVLLAAAFGWRGPLIHAEYRYHQNKKRNK